MHGNPSDGPPAKTIARERALRDLLAERGWQLHIKAPLLHNDKNVADFVAKKKRDLQDNLTYLLHQDRRIAYITGLVRAAASLSCRGRTRTCHVPCTLGQPAAAIQRVTTHRHRCKTKTTHRHWHKTLSTETAQTATWISTSRKVELLRHLTNGVKS